MVGNADSLRNFAAIGFLAHPYRARIRRGRVGHLPSLPDQEFGVECLPGFTSWNCYASTSNLTCGHGSSSMNRRKFLTASSAMTAAAFAASSAPAAFALDQTRSRSSVDLDLTRHRFGVN